MAEVEFQTPIIVSDENFKPGHVRVIVSIPGLKQAKKAKNNCKNADVSYEFDKRSMCLTVEGQEGQMLNKNYQLKIKKLPGDILENSSYIQVQDKRILVMLAKVDKKSWYPALNDGLETFEEIEEENNPEEMVT